MKTRDTVTRLLDEAQRLVQERGFNAFSYRDLADSVGIRTASIHYHFPSKGDLAQALAERYLTEMEGVLRAVDRESAGPEDRLRRFIESHRRLEAQGVICLVGSMASDAATLPEEVCAVLERYVDMVRGWVSRAVEDGVEAGEFQPMAAAADAAAALVSGLQGGLLLANTRCEGVGIEGVERAFFALLGKAGPAGA